MKRFWATRPDLALRERLSLGGRLHILQPWALLPGPAALLIALAAPYRWLFFLAYGYMLVLAACYFWLRHVGPRIELQRHVSGAWAEVGDELEETWVLSNRSRLPLVWLELDDASTLPGYTGRRVVAAGIGETSHWMTGARCTRRGVFSIGPLTARTADPLGLFGYEWQIEAVRQIVIYPPLIQLPDIRIPQGQRGGLARADLLQQFVTPSVGGLREYVQGDQPSRIHWPTVARTQRLMVKEFDQERAGALWIALDLYAGAYKEQVRQPKTPTARAESGVSYSQSSLVANDAPQGMLTSQLELAIVLACSLAAKAIGEGRAVGLLADDGRQRFIQPGQGPRQLWRILSALVDVQATGKQPLRQVIKQGNAAFSTHVSHAALALITPDMSGIWLPELAAWRPGRSGGALALLVVDGEAQVGELEARLAGLGTVVHTFRVGTHFSSLHPPKPRSVTRVSPLGRVQTAR